MKYNGLIGHYSNEEMPDNIKKYKERIDSLFLSSSKKELDEKLENFTEEEVKYLGCTYLDEFKKIYKRDDILKEAIKEKVSFEIFKLYFKFENTAWNRVLGDMDIPNRNSLLVLASRYGYPEVVNLLLKNEADIHVCNDSALRWASQNGHLSVVKLLVERGADVHARNDEALKTAAFNGHLPIVNFLIGKGADVHAENDRALRLASENGKLLVVDRLLKAGADARVLNKAAKDTHQKLE